MRIIFGSHNYNLNTPESDLDVAVFRSPTFDELYEGKTINSIQTSEELDTKVIDIRSISKMVARPCINDLEYFCSVDATFDSFKEEKLYKYVKDNIEIITNNHREGIILSCIGYMNDKLTDSIKSSEARRKSIEMHKYDIKSLYAFFRNYEIINRLINNAEFKDAIFFENGSQARDFLIKIKSGKISDYTPLYEKAQRIMYILIDDIKPKMISKKIERKHTSEYLEIIDTVKKMIKEIVREDILYSL